jgi:hypothetical protein
MMRVLAVLQEGLNSAEHRVFVQQLAERSGLEVAIAAVVRTAIAKPAYKDSVSL